MLTTNVIGNTHNANQDFLIHGENYGIVADGCSGCAYSEVGTRFVLQLYNMLPDKADPNKFEKNVNKVINDVVAMLKSFGHSEDVKNISNTFIANNMLFTLLACFETEDKYIVFTLGDGFIITRNMFGEFSFTHIDYDNQPPYICYNYMEDDNGNVSNTKIPFKKFEYPKEFFLGVGVATDGIAPVVESLGTLTSEDRSKFEAILSDEKKMGDKQNTVLKNFISKMHKMNFADDTTLVFLGG